MIVFKAFHEIKRMFRFMYLSNRAIINELQLYNELYNIQEEYSSDSKYRNRNVTNLHFLTL